MKAKQKYLKYKNSWSKGQWWRRYKILRTCRWRKHKKAA